MTDDLLAELFDEWWTKHLGSTSGEFTMTRETIRQVFISGAEAMLASLLKKKK